MRRILCIVISIGIGGCSSVPPYDLTVHGPPSAPAGPKVAALLANLKCELHDAANSQEVIPRYYDDPSLAQHYDPSVPGYKPSIRHADPQSWFTLKHLFEEIEYVGEAQFELDVSSTPGVSSSVSFINPTPNLTLSVNGSLSEEAHRNIQINSSIDFERLVASPPFRSGRNMEGPVASFAPTLEEPSGSSAPSVPCNGKSELGGFLGLQEDLTYHAITGDMNDLSVWPSAGTVSKLSSSDFSQWGVDVIAIQIDFTVTSGLSGGPQWTLTRFTGPNGSSGLANFSRAVKDTLTLTILPICIRQKYRATNRTPPYNYVPEFIEGTPRWANFLPPCEIGQSLKGQAVSTARTLNILKTDSRNTIAVTR
jgi:hypothetical protein